MTTPVSTPEPAYAPSNFTTPSHFEGPVVYNGVKYKVVYDLLKDETPAQFHEKLKVIMEVAEEVYLSKNNRASALQLDFQNKHITLRSTDGKIVDASKVTPQIPGLMNRICSCSKALSKRIKAISSKIARIYPVATRKKEDRGIEPKFVGFKQWSESDTCNLLDNKDHKYYQDAQKYLKELKENGIEGFDTSTFDVDNLKNNRPEVIQLLKDHIQKNELKFHKKHFVKLDYNKKPGEKRIAKEYNRALALVTRQLPKILKIFSPLVASIYTEATKKKVEDVNFSAVTECLGNDLYRILGFGGSKVKIIEDVYEDGMPKLYLDSTEARGPHGEPAQSFTPSIHKETGKKTNGRFDGNHVTVHGTKVALNTQALAKGLAPALLLGDYDKWGIRGDNILFYVSSEDGLAYPLNIDPGKALSFSDKMHSHPLEGLHVHSDASFSPSRGIFETPFKNFSLFMDTKLSERMEGFKAILDEDKWNEVEALFDKYIAQYGTSRKTEGLDYSKQLEQMRDILRARRAYMGEVLKDKIGLSSDELDLLSNLEKLTSPTKSTVSVDGREIKLDHLEVIPQTRVEWSLRKVGEDTILECKSPKVEKKIEQFLKDQGLHIEVARAKGKVQIKFPTALTAVLCYDIFYESAITDFKSRSSKTQAA